MDVMISYRSGIDPLIYGQMDRGNDGAQELAQSTGWQELRASMRNGTVIVCEPVQGRLSDDGIRLISESKEEWMATHELFCDTLNQHRIPYVVLAASMTCIEQRVGFVSEVAGMISGEE